MSDVSHRTGDGVGWFILVGPFVDTFSTPISNMKWIKTEWREYMDPRFAYGVNGMTVYKWSRLWTNNLRNYDGTLEIFLEKFIKDCFGYAAYANFSKYSFINVFTVLFQNSVQKNFNGFLQRFYQVFLHMCISSLIFTDILPRYYIGIPPEEE